VSTDRPAHRRDREAGAAPRVSVVIEGYNESRDLGSADDAMAALLRQEFPLHAIEVILVGSAAQVAAWQARWGEGTPFHRVLAVPADGAHYYALKNEGVRHATADVLALLDSDACPEPGWIAALVEAIDGGADVSAGVTLFRGDDGRAPSSPMMQVAAAISWGFVLPRGTAADAPPTAFLSHNVGFRAATFRRHAYRTDLGRTCAGSFLFADLRAAGARMVFVPKQRVAHVFTFSWWVLRLHRRFGYEVMLLRRLEGTQRHGWLTRARWLEPLLTMLWHMVLDVPQWWRFAPVAGVSPARRVLLLPLVVVLSFCARGGEMLGMLQTLAAPEEMKRFAESN
jgi:glycosyltransferase involved in cell wall biosynthesis